MIARICLVTALAMAAAAAQDPAPFSLVDCRFQPGRPSLGPVKIGGRQYSDSLSVQGKTTLRFSVNADVRTFVADAGFPPSAVDVQSAVAVRLDGREAFRTQFVAGAAPVPVRVELAGAKVVELSAETRGKAPPSLWFAWAQPRFVLAGGGEISIPRELLRQAKAGTSKLAAMLIMPYPPAMTTEAVEPETRQLTAAEAEAALREDWLFQADRKPLAARAAEEIGWARELAARLARMHAAPSFQAELGQLDRLEQQLKTLPKDAANGDAARALYFRVREVKRRVAFRNPAVDFTKVLLLDNPYPEGHEWAHEARHRNGMMAVPGGRLLIIDGLHPGGKIVKLAPDVPGSFWRPDLSFDARKVLFSYKPHNGKAFHVYEVDAAGGRARKITTGPYDDLDPIYLPDGGIMFSTTRCNTYIRCMPYTYAYVLARADSDGGNVRLLGLGNETEYLPTLLDDGRVMYTRWEYTDKSVYRIQSLWTMNPDGTNNSVYWGNQSVWPDMLVEPRQIPGNGKILFAGAAHHNWFTSSIGVVDNRKGFNFPHGLTKITADVAWPESGNGPVDPIESPHHHRAGAYDSYQTPYPLSAEDFLVSARRGGKFRLYLMDVHGNRELIYEGAHQVWHAVPFQSRKRPPARPVLATFAKTEEERANPAPGVFYSADLYQGVPELPRGRVKHLRIVQSDYKTYSSWTRDHHFSGPAVSIFQEDSVKRILGTVPVEPDGSFHFLAPPGRMIQLQALDEHYRAMQTMRTFTGLMPGERRGCTGCHEMHSTAPPNSPGAALRRAPSTIQPPPWGAGESVGYERFVQPVLDRYCGSCHQGNGAARAKLDLTLRPGPGIFAEPYATLVGGDGVNWTPPPGRTDVKKTIAGVIRVEDYHIKDPEAYVTLPPLTTLSSKSPLIEIVMSGRHHGVRVDALSLQRLIAWVDANGPYRGEEEIRKLPDPEFAGIDLLPVRPRVRTAPVIHRP
jgi:hypothetical protein